MSERAYERELTSDRQLLTARSPSVVVETSPIPRYKQPHRPTVPTVPYVHHAHASWSVVIMSFHGFDTICQKAAIPLCSLVGPASSISGSTGIIPNCYARNIELANTIIFEGAAAFMHVIALFMTVIMILHVRSKFTAVGGCQKKKKGMRGKGLHG